MPFARAFALALAMTVPAAAWSATVNATGLVTNAVIFGSGNVNGSFTGVTVGGLELALRAKLRYDATSACGGFGCPQNSFNLGPGDSYTFSDAAANQPANRSVFNFEWSINSNANATGGALTDLSYRIDVDTDPTWNMGSQISYDPLSALSTGYYLGTNASAQGSATFSAPGTGNLASFNLAQNSVNLGFLPGATLGQGRFTIRLSAFTPGNVLRASTAIHVVVDAPAPVPLPAGGALLAAGLFALTAARRRGVSDPSF